MTRGEFLRIVDRMGRLWPQSGLSDPDRVDPDTLEVWLDLWGGLDAETVRDAIDALAREGERYAPPPGLVFRRAEEIAVSRSMRPDPELLRLPTAEERETFGRWKVRWDEAKADLARKLAMDPEAR